MGTLEIYNRKTEITNQTISVKRFVNDDKFKEDMLRYMHLNKYWGKCHCIQPPAIVYPRLQGDSYQLVNKPVEGLHHKGCPLFSNVSDKVQAGEGPTPSSTPPKSFSPIQVGVNVSERKGDNEDVEERAKRGNTDRIHQILTYAFSEKFFDYIKQDKTFKLFDLYQTKAFNIGAKNGFKFGDYVYMEPGKTNFKWREHSLSKQDNLPESTPVQAYIINLVDNVTYDRNEEKLHVEHMGMKYQLSCSNVSHHYEITSGARLMFLMFTYIDECWELKRAYTHPIVNTSTPVLIDSNLERQFVLQCLAQTSEPIMIYKHYHYTQFNDRKLLPDFTVKNLNSKKRCIVEVMGKVNDDNYVENKEELVPLMEARYKMTVKEVLPATFDQDIVNILSFLR